MPHALERSIFSKSFKFNVLGQVVCSSCSVILCRKFLADFFVSCSLPTALISTITLPVR